MNEISVLGSINLDTTYHVDHIPLPGETLHVNKKTAAAGGKGANQAVAAQRSGSKVHFIGAIGKDNGGEFMSDTMKDEGIDLSQVLVIPKVDTGTATILLGKGGQNSILVDPGANASVFTDQIEKATDVIKNSNYIIAQFETPISTTIAAFKIARQNNVKTILNPAPANEVSDELLSVTDIIAPNETESKAITGIDTDSMESLAKSAEFFQNKGVKVVLITLGERGVFYATKDKQEIIPAHKVKAIDTTGAGDTFIGAMSAKLNDDLSNLSQAIEYGQQASSITVQNMGAMPSIPTKDQIEYVYGKEN